jgi:hypothetical protein
MSLFRASEACSSGLVILFLRFCVGASDLCEFWSVNIHEYYSVMSRSGGCASVSVPRSVLLLEVSWLRELLSSCPLVLGMAWKLDSLPILILLYLGVSCCDVLIYGGRRDISVEDSVLEFVFDSHCEELNGWSMREIEVCLLGIVFELCDVVVESVLLHAQLI